MEICPFRFKESFFHHQTVFELVKRENAGIDEFGFVDVLPDLFDMYSVGYCQGGQGWQADSIDYGDDHFGRLYRTAVCLGLGVAGVIWRRQLFAWFPQVACW